MSAKRINDDNGTARTQKRLIADYALCLREKNKPPKYKEMIVSAFESRYADSGMYTPEIRARLRKNMGLEGDGK